MKTLAPVIDIVVGAKSKNLQVGQATANFFKIVSGGKVLSLTDLHGIVLRKKLCKSFQIKSAR